MAKVPAPTTSTFTIAATAADMHATFIAWQEQISPRDRAAMAALVRSRDLTTITGMMQFHQDIIGAMFEGTLSPVVAMAAKPWVESMLVMIANREVPKEDRERDMVALIVQMKEKVRGVRPTYTERRELEDNTIESTTLDPNEEMAKLLAVGEE